MDAEENDQESDGFREMNHYQGSDADYRSEAVYAPPRRTVTNGWKKFHATHECGSGNVRFVESQHSGLGESFDYDLVCTSCGHRVDEEDVLFIGGQWGSKELWKYYNRPLTDLQLSSERVLELGTNPTREDVERALTLTRIEREVSLMGFSFGNGTWEICDECEAEVPVQFDGCCRACYDGKWTERMQAACDSLGTLVRERNGSFAHRLDVTLTPSRPGDTILVGSVLWRRSSESGFPKIVQVVQRLQDVDTGDNEYVLADVQDINATYTYRLSQEDVDSMFWDMELQLDEDESSSENSNLQTALEAVSE